MQCVTGSVNTRCYGFSTANEIIGYMQSATVSLVSCISEQSTAATELTVNETIILYAIVGILQEDMLRGSKSMYALIFLCIRFHTGRLTANSQLYNSITNRFNNKDRITPTTANIRVDACNRYARHTRMLGVSPFSHDRSAMNWRVFNDIITHKI